MNIFKMNPTPLINLLFKPFYFTRPKNILLSASHSLYILLNLFISLDRYILTKLFISAYARVIIFLNSNIYADIDVNP